MVISSEESQAHKTLMARQGRGEAGVYPVGPSDIAGAFWFKSSRSAYNGSCVEVARLSRGRIGVRDTKANGMGPVLLFTHAEWEQLTARVRSGDLDFS
jgi:Domain of unknown function (DUF397)